MEIQPRYDSDPVIVIEGSIDDIRRPFLRQRRRLASTLHQLSDQEWAAPSRCEGWSSKDVIAHLASTDGFWGASIAGALAGTPTKYLVGFDPVATPAALADAASSIAPSEGLATYVSGVEDVCRLVESLSDDDFTSIGEAPPGHMSVQSVIHHALWDSWVHERDVLLPLGRAAVEQPDEIAASLRYAAALSPTFSLMNDPDLVGTLAVEVTDPDLRIVVEIGSSIAVHDDSGVEGGPAAVEGAVLRGEAVDVLEQLSIRRPLDHDVPVDHQWMVSGLAEVFETSAD